MTSVIPGRVQVIWLSGSVPPVVDALLGCWRKSMVFHIEEHEFVRERAGIPFATRDDIGAFALPFVRHDAAVTIVCLAGSTDITDFAEPDYVDNVPVYYVSSYAWSHSFLPEEFRWCITLLALGLLYSLEIRCTDEECILNPQAILDPLFEPFPAVCDSCEKQLKAADPQAAAELRETLHWIWVEVSPSPPTSEDAWPILPVTGFVVREARERLAQPLQPFDFVLILHLLPDLIPLLAAFVELGLDPARCTLIGKPYPYAGKIDTVLELRERGFHVLLASEHVARHSAHSVSQDLVRRALAPYEGTANELIVVEDGGYVAAELLEGGMLQPKGIVEQTAKGARVSEQAEDLRFPVVSVAGSHTKSEWEAPLIGRVVAENIRALLPNRHFDDGRAVILGFGSIGENVARMLAAYLKMRVFVVDPDPAARERAEQCLLERADRQEGDEPGFVSGVAERLEEVAGGVMLVVGTSGTTSLAATDIDLLPNEVVLASASSDRLEIAVNVLEQYANPLNTHVKSHGVVDYVLADGRKVTVLADGYPVNFYSAYSVPNDSIDLILLLLLLSAVETATTDLPARVDKNLPDTLAKQYDIRRVFNLLHGLGS